MDFDQQLDLSGSREAIMRRTRFTQYAWGVLVYNLFVVLWGAVVRASGSGDGCGKHWPLCGGNLAPVFQRVATMIEYSHRLSSGLVVPLVVILFIWGYKAYPKGHPVRLGVALAVLLTIIEAALGAGLVLLGLVGTNQSPARFFMMSWHLINTLLLLMSISLTAWWSASGRPISFRGQGNIALLLGVGLCAALFLAVSGSITALIDTLYPSTNLWAALRQDMAPTTHYMIRLRLLHPIIAISVGIFTALMASYVARTRPSSETKRFARNVIAIFWIDVAAGFLNVWLLAPVGMQLLHLLLTDLLWINLVLLTAAALPKGFSD